MNEQEFQAKLDALLEEYADACTMYGGAAEMWKASKQYTTERDTAAMEYAASKAEEIRQQIIALIPKE